MSNHLYLDNMASSFLYWISGVNDTGLTSVPQEDNSKISFQEQKNPDLLGFCLFI